MGWQSRLKDKPKFEKTCNKCSGTGVKRKFVSVAGIAGAEELEKCKCVLKRELAEKLAADAAKAAKHAVVVESEDTLALEASG